MCDHICVSLYLSICISTYLPTLESLSILSISIHPSIHPSIHLSIHPSIQPAFHLSLFILGCTYQHHHHHYYCCCYYYYYYHIHHSHYFCIIQIKYYVDPSFLKPGENQLFLQYLYNQTMHLDVWDGDSLLLLGSSAIDLKVSHSPIVKDLR